MSAPEFLCSSYRYFSRSGVSDVATIITDFESETVTYGNWTLVSAGLYKSPADNVSRWMDILLTRISQYKLEMRLRDNLGVTICTRRINLPSTNNWIVRIYTGQFHAIIDVDPGSLVYEHLTAGILDLSPEAQNAHTHFVYGGGTRNTSDALDAYGTNPFQLYAIDNVTPTGVVRVGRFSGNYGSYSLYGGRTLNGSRVFRMREVFIKAAGALYLSYAGRCYQQILVDAFIQPSSELLIPIDTGLTAKFKCMGYQDSVGYVLPWRVAVRIA